MKKVVIKQELKEVSVSNLSTDKYYGIKEVSKGFISQSDYDSNRFIVLCVMGITLGNSWGSYSNCRSLKTLTEKLISDGFEVYEFDTYKELFKWLSE